MAEDSVEKLEGLKVSLCQMKVEPGRPDLNATYIIEEIEAAKIRGMDIIIFPEMCTTGCIVGDIFEDDFFIEDVLRWNKKIIEATRNGIAAIFGTVDVALFLLGNDGRKYRYDSVIAAQNGKILAACPKALHSNLRFINNDRHFCSNREVAEEKGVLIGDLFSAPAVETGIGEIKVGLTIGDDLFDRDYVLHPIISGANREAELIVNISALPWVFQKGQTQQNEAGNMAIECKAPIICVNNTGSQSIGKNFVVFDGKSAVYDKDGRIIFGIPMYKDGTYDFEFSKNAKVFEFEPRDDVEELYMAMTCATKSAVPMDMKVLVGLSGGIDSAVVCAHMVDVLGPARVIAINMPMPSLNSSETKDFARQIAERLGIAYEIVPINEMVEAVCKATGVEPKTLAYENIQARIRQEVLSAKAQKVGGVFACCSNKVEAAFGYGTMYGDVSGFYAPLGDLNKRQVRQIAGYLNQVRFRKEVIPERCINQIPSAELAEGQKDPFDYGNADRRGYHDEMVGAILESRKNPEWFLEQYLKGRLDEKLGLEPGTIKRLFATNRDFINDLERWWQSFHRTSFKRIQCPPIPIFSDRAFGADFEESSLSAHFTEKYKYLKRYLLSLLAFPKEKIIVFGGSFNPSAVHHQIIAENLAKVCDRLIIVPCGMRADKTIAGPLHRKKMAQLTFRKIPKVELDFYDIDNNVFTPTYLLLERYEKLYPDAEIWFAIGDDLVRGGQSGDSEIQHSWIEGRNVWQNFKFIVVTQPGKMPDPKDLPPSAQVLEIKAILGRSTAFRERISRGEPVDGLVTSEVALYIKEKNLYR